MRKEYDFLKLKPAFPRYLKMLKKPITMRLDIGVFNYFKKISKTMGIPYQSLINYILREYAQHEIKPSANWDLLTKKRVI
ncbi:MAG: BrnA antitoxin family protein [Deltaproteobacteria bacterium]|nr:BrnA antitoxin family protein [Deltaproteobacteria bacterium]MBI4924511.1 BrnA antitoxin family protein [Bdellovibrio sp.]